MKQSKIYINLNPVFLKEKADCEKCHCCGDSIYFNKYRLWVMPETQLGSLLGSKTDMVLCESCNNLIK